jgi:outer membrane protein W
MTTRPLYRYADIATGTLKREIGISIQFQQPEVFMSTYTTTQQVKNQLINYILTNPGERMFQPYYGAGIRQGLFEQNQIDFSGLEETLKTGIEQNVQNIVVKSVNTSSTGDNTINIGITYSINGIVDELNVEIATS